MSDTGSGGPPLQEAGIDELLDRLEQAMARLADGSLPLDELLRADEEQWRLVAEVQARLRKIMATVEQEAAGRHEP